MITVHIAQNFGTVKLWRIDHFRVLARKVLANDVHFAKCAKDFVS